jgi:hypothetical protein
MANPHTGQNKSLTSAKLSETRWFDISESLIIFMNSASPTAVLSTETEGAACSRRIRRHDTLANVVSDLEARGDSDMGVITIRATKRIKSGDELLLRPYLN